MNTDRATTLEEHAWDREATERKIDRDDLLRTLAWAIDDPFPLGCPILHILRIDGGALGIGATTAEIDAARTRLKARTTHAEEPLG